VTEESVTIKSDGVNIIYHLPIYKNTNPNQNNQYINLVSLKKMVKTVENYPAFNPHFGFERKLYIEGKEFSEFAQIPERVTEYGINNFILESKTLHDTIKPLPTAKSSNNSNEIVVPEEDDTEENTKDVQKNSDLKKITISTLFLACVGITASGASSYFLYRKLSKKKS
jgi:hypothetical protein